MKSGNLNFLESSGQLQACNRTALLLLLIKTVLPSMVYFLKVFGLMYRCFFFCHSAFASFWAMASLLLGFGAIEFLWGMSAPHPFSNLDNLGIPLSNALLKTCLALVAIPATQLLLAELLTSVMNENILTGLNMPSTWVGVTIERIYICSSCIY